MHCPHNKCFLATKQTLTKLSADVPSHLCKSFCSSFLCFLSRDFPGLFSLYLAQKWGKNLTLEYVPQGWVNTSKNVITHVRNTTAVAQGWRSSPAGGGGDTAPG